MDKKLLLPIETYILYKIYAREKIKDLIFSEQITISFPALNLENQ